MALKNYFTCIAYILSKDSSYMLPCEGRGPQSSHFKHVNKRKKANILTTNVKAKKRKKKDLHSSAKD